MKILFIITNTKDRDNIEIQSNVVYKIPCQENHPSKILWMLGTVSVSYTHLDVYKRQALCVVYLW